MKHSKVSGILWGILLLLTILDSKTAANSANLAIEMCLRSVIPSLFPMIFLSGMLTGNLGGRYGLFLAGILGGYPVGAKCIAQAYDQGSLSGNDALRMLGYCNHPGPAFIFGILGHLFESSLVCWVIWLIIIASAVLTAYTLGGKAVAVTPKGISPAESLHNSLYAIAKICGWVILFRVLIGFAEKWVFHLLPEYIPLILTGLLELTNGCLGLAQVAEPSHRFLLAVFFLTAGGICVAMQTASVTGELGLGMYFPGKVIQVSWAMLLAMILHPWLYPGERMILPFVALPAVSIIIARIRITKFKNNSSNLSPAVV